MIGTEDCLYLSLYVPKNALDNNLHLPVYLYFHGGAYLGGASNIQDGAYIASTQNLGRGYRYIFGTPRGRVRDPRKSLFQQTTVLVFLGFGFILPLTHHIPKSTKIRFSQVTKAY